MKNKIQELIVLRGLPGSGKTTYAREWVEWDSTNRIRVNRDDLRLIQSLDWYKSKKTLKERESYLTKVEESLIMLGLSEGKSVIVDATNFKDLQRFKDIIKIMSEINKLNIKFTLKPIATSIEECIKRDSLRGTSKVGVKVIHNMYKKYIDPTSKINPEWFKKRDVRNYLRQNNLKNANPEVVFGDVELDTLVTSHDVGLKENAFIFDLDGTLSLMQGRSPYEGKDCFTDAVNEPVLQMLKDLKSNGYTIIILSGRNSDKGGKKTTEDWLGYKDIPYDKLIMRKEGDQRKDDLIKKEFLFELMDNYVIKGVFDDRDQVVKMWREMGIPCYQVWNGNF